MGDCHTVAGGTAGGDAKDQCTPQSSAFHIGRHPKAWFAMCGSIFKSDRTVSAVIIFRTSERI